MQHDDFFVVGLGASAGGIKAFKEFFENVPPDSGIAYVVILHLSPQHESSLAEVLQSSSRIPVTQVQETVRLQPNHVYVIPRDASLRIEQGLLKLEARQKTRVPHRPIDSFFESLTQERHDRAGALRPSTAT
jgi:two-component system CheB/CheR fusion protein